MSNEPRAFALCERNAALQELADWEIVAIYERLEDLQQQIRYRDRFVMLNFVMIIICLVAEVCSK